MKISYNWLSQYISLSESAETLSSLLTDTGLEVEGLAAYESVRGGLKGLVVGEVITCGKHPNADKLSLTTVNVGDKIIPVVCGAANVAAGQKVIVALPNATLYPIGGAPFTIKSSKIRGEISEGMICAEDEIGVGKGHDGIMVLATNCPNGTPAATYFNCTSDSVFEINLTPNRADAASHLGVARDLKAALNRKIKWPDVSAFKVDTQSPFHVSVESPACPRYSAVYMTGIKVQESPAWFKQRLESIGVKPINNVVDITNFVLHETGQPLHAFDADKIVGKKIIVKTLPQNTPFITLDGKERKLAAADLMICDENGGLCLAGILGGINSGVSDHTSSLFLESAYFSTSSIRRSGIFHQLKTDASFRFERGVDPNLAVYALKRAALLIKEMANGKISSDVIDIYPQKIEPKKIVLTWNYINRLIGKSIPREEVISILRNLDFEVTSTADLITVLTPTYRVEVTQPADVVEEILRIYGFNQIELSEHVGTSYIAEFPQKDSLNFKRTISDLLASHGFYEILTNSLTHIDYPQKFPVFSRPVEIMNKLSEEQGIMRQTLLYSGLEVCAHNINRKQKDLKLFELGKIYGKGDDYWEEERLSIFMTGLAQPQNWQYESKPVTYYELAKYVASVVEKAGLAVRQENKSHELLEYGSCLLAGKKEIGFLGKVKNQVCREFGIKQEVFYADLSTEALFQASNPTLVVKEAPQFPEVRRDISLVLDKTVTFTEIKELIRVTEKKLIKDVITFDVYEGNSIPEDKKAYAIGLILWDTFKTLTDKEIDDVVNRLIAAFEQKMNALIRK